uniref:VQ domain-containing protein n=1 Tax=Salix viminalis TaxID=40686 RepID=A0A6N2LZ62_SALVM
MNRLTEQYSGRQEPKRGKKPTKHKKEPIKITYISSPTMVKATNASEFRAIVQELTGKDSKVEDPFDAYPVIGNDEEEEASQVPRYGTPQFNVAAGGNDVFPSNTSFLQTEDGFFWGDVSDMSFDLQSPISLNSKPTEQICLAQSFSHFVFIEFGAFKDLDSDSDKCYE